MWARSTVAVLLLGLALSACGFRQAIVDGALDCRFDEESVVHTELFPDVDVAGVDDPEQLARQALEPWLEQGGTLHLWSEGVATVEIDGREVAQARMLPAQKGGWVLSGVNHCEPRASGPAEAEGSDA